jgi:valyl-tRNA synthetase
MDISPARPIPLIFYNGTTEDKRRLNAYTELLSAIARPESVTWLNTGEALPVANVQLIGEMQLLVPLAGLIDKHAELQRLAKELDRLANDIKRSSGKLTNPNFINKAPEDVVFKEKLKLADFEQALKELTLQKNRISDL